MNRFFLWVLMCGMFCASSVVGKASDAPPIQITWRLNTNFINKEAVYSNTLCLKNIGKEVLGKDWDIYFNQVPRAILSQVSKGNVLRVRNVNGDFFQLMPTENFGTLAPDSSICITYTCPDWVIKESDAPIGFYLVFRDTLLHPIPIVLPEVIEPLDVTRIQRSAQDHYPVPTASSIFEANALHGESRAVGVFDILPRIKRVSLSNGSLNIRKLRMVSNSALENEVSLLSEYLEEAKLLTKNSEGIPISLRIDSSLQKYHKETYWIKIHASDIDISGTNEVAVAYAIQTLRSILRSPQTVASGTLPCADLVDFPDLAYRGQFIDVGRNFQSKQEILKLLDVFARYKINKFHFHLTDDEGWRLAIDGLPELTDIGAKRGHAGNCLHPAYGSGPFADPAQSAGSGYYTAADFIEILKFAKRRHIEVIPEIDLPGHARAAIIAMQARYENYVQLGDTVRAEEYLLNDPMDTSRYASVQGYTDNTVCVAKESVYRFWDHVTTELCKMYGLAGMRLETLHIGGDEVPKGVWTGSPLCAQLIASHPKLSGVKDLPNYFLERTSEIMKRHGVSIGGWQEIGLVDDKHPNPEFVHEKFTTYCWNTVADWGGEEIPYQLANFGYPVILCNAPNLYFDFAYNKDPRERGYYWGGFVDEQSSFDLLPFNIYNSIRMDRNGKRMEWLNRPTQTALTRKGWRNIVGVQGQVWSETVRTPEVLEYSLFPKMFGLIERGWNVQPDWSTETNAGLREKGYQKDLEQYLSIIGKHEFPLLSEEGVNFRLPAPGILLKNGRVSMNCETAGCVIKYTTDNTMPNEQSKTYTHPFVAQGKVIRAQVFLNHVASLESSLHIR